MEYPDNSYEAKRKFALEESEKAEKPETAERGKVIRKKKTIWGKITDTFTGEDARSVVNSIIWDMLAPAARDAVVDAIQQGIARLVLGESQASNRRPGYRPGNSPNRTNYQRYSQPPAQRDNRSTNYSTNRHARKSDYRNIVLDNRQFAEEIIKHMEDRIHRLGNASISDLYQELQVPESEYTYVDEEWGWFSARGFDVARDRDGWRLVLPHAENLKP